MIRTLVTAGLLAAVLAIPVVARQEPAPVEAAELKTATSAPTPAERVVKLRSFLAAHPKSELLGAARASLVRALVAADAPSAELVSATGAAALLMTDEIERAPMYMEVAAALGSRNELLDTAEAMAQKAVAAIPAEDAEFRAEVQAILGGIQVARGEIKPAIETLTASLGVLGDHQDALYFLGQAYEKAGNDDAAVEAYLKAAGVFLGRNTRPEPALRVLWARRNGTAGELDARLEATRKASRNQAIFVAPKWERQAPAWELPDLAGKTVRLADFKGRIVVMDFWGSWCPPCRAELPKFQEMVEKYAKNDKVVFLGMNWERPDEPAVRIQLARDFMTKNGYTFPVVADHDRTAAEAYELQGFPTVFLIDAQGMIRYRNVGYDTGVEEIIETQLESMLE